MSKVIVAGSIITDMSVSVENHPKVGETVIGTELKYSPGGKGANQAIAAARLGAATAMIGSVGKDSFGEMSIDFFLKEGVSNNTIYSNKPTGIAMIQVSKTTGNNSIAVILGANEDLDIEVFDRVAVDIEEGDILVSQFEIPLETVEEFFKRGRDKNCINILNPAPAIDIPQSILDVVDILIVNETEVEAISKFKINRVAATLIDNVITAMNRISNKMKKDSVIITTLGDKGSLVMRNRHVMFISPIKVDVVDTTGAGDCFVGAFASYISKNDISTNDGLKNAAMFANKAASLSVQKQGSGISMPYLKDIVTWK